MSRELDTHDLLLYAALQLVQYMDAGDEDKARWSRTYYDKVRAEYEAEQAASYRDSNSKPTG